MPVRRRLGAGAQRRGVSRGGVSASAGMQAAGQGIRISGGARRGALAAQQSTQIIIGGTAGEGSGRGRRSQAAVRGPRGKTGPQGPVGKRGIPGQKGSKGDAGLRGLRGIAGPIGQKGSKGEKGAPGEVRNVPLSKEIFSRNRVEIGRGALGKAMQNAFAGAQIGNLRMTGGRAQQQPRRRRAGQRGAP